MIRGYRLYDSPSSLCLLLALAFLAASPAQAKDKQEKVSKGSDEKFIEKIGNSVGNSLDSYDATAVTYFLHIPDTYRKDRKYAMVLSISPGPTGRGMFATWREAAKTYNFFFACPDKAGNQTPTAPRGQAVVDTLFDVRAKFNIDPDLIFVTGFSGGGRMSTLMVKAFPNRFAGHIPIGGIFAGSRNDVLNLKVRLGTYIFAGETCFNRKESEMALKMLKDAGMPVELMIGPGLAHTIPNATQGVKIFEWFLGRTRSSELPGVDLAALSKDEKSAFKKIAKEWVNLGKWCSSKKLVEEAQTCVKRAKGVCPRASGLSRLEKSVASKARKKYKPKDKDIEAFKGKWEKAAEKVAAMYDELAEKTASGDTASQERSGRYRLTVVQLSPTEERWTKALAVLEKLVAAKDRAGVLGLARLLKKFNPPEEMVKKIGELVDKAKQG